MTIVLGKDKLLSILPQGKIGTRKGVPSDRAHYADALARNKWAGIYQRKLTKQGKKISLMPHYYPTNPRTPKQQAWRQIFVDGKEAWDNLTQTQKHSYNRRAIPLIFSGYNLFQREYLAMHKSVLKGR